MSDTFIGVPIGSIEKKAVPESGDRILLETKDGLRVAEWGEASKNSGNQLSYNIDDKIVPATDIVSFVDKNTGESVNYRETTKWIDGSAISDAKADGVIFKKIAGKFYKMNFVGVINLGLFGAKQDGITDDTDAINRGMLYAAKTGGCAFEFNANSKVKVYGTILLPTNTKINLNGSELFGNNNNTMFNSAYLVNGNLVSNENAVDEAIEAQLRYSAVYNGTIRGAKRGFFLKNFIIGCFLRDLTFNGCEQSWFCHRCFYPLFENIISINAVNTANIFAYHFNESNNAIVLKRVTAGTEFGTIFKGGTTAITIEGYTAEGGSRGLVFEGDCFGIKINGSYFEAIKDVFDFSKVTNGNFSITGNYINMTDRVMISPLFPNSLWGIFDETNTIVNVGTTYNGFTYRGLMEIDTPRNMMKYSYISNVINENKLPSNWKFGQQNNVELISAAGITNSTFMGKTKNVTGIIPVVRSGDVGDGYPGYILGVEHSLRGSAGNFYINIDTKIKLTNNVFVKFNINLTIGGNEYNVFGDLYGSNVKQQDSSRKNVGIENNNGYVRLVVGVFTENDVNYEARGSVQLIV